MHIESKVGEFLINNEKFIITIFDRKCIIKTDKHDLIKKINCSWIEVKTHEYIEFNHKDVYKIYIENLHYVCFDTYECDIVYSYFCDIQGQETKSISFFSLAITNFFNDKIILSNDFTREDYLDLVKENMKKKKEFTVNLSFGKYKLILENVFLLDNEAKFINAIAPYTPQTVLTFEKEEGFINCEDILLLIKYVFNLNRFITLNKYTKIDWCSLNYNDNTIRVEILKEYEKTNECNESFKLSDFGNKAVAFFENNGDFLKHSDNMYLFEEDRIYAFDIIRISGAFEKIFNKYVSKSLEYKKNIDKIKEEVHYREFKSIVDQFVKNMKLERNEIFNNMYRNFTNFDTLKQKLDFIIKSFSKTMKFNCDDIKDFSIFYTPKDLSQRFKNARNDIGHGLEKTETNWRGASEDSIFVQQLIYFIILKYKLNVADENIFKALNRIYYFINISFKK